MKKRFRIALAGNPNCGKTCIFNALTGARQHVGNYPGVTVESKSGRFELNGMEIDDYHPDRIPISTELDGIRLSPSDVKMLEPFVEFQ